MPEVTCNKCGWTGKVNELHFHPVDVGQPYQCPACPKCEGEDMHFSPDADVPF